MLGFQPVQFDFVGLVLGLLLQAAGSRRQFVFLLAQFRPLLERRLVHRCHLIDGAAQFVQLLADALQFPWIRCQIVAVSLACLSAMLQSSNNNNSTPPDGPFD